MANVFLNLPVPAGANGAGAAVNVSSTGSSKTLVVSGVAIATVTIEANNDPAAAGAWSPLVTFQGAGIVQVMAAAHWMRARIGGYRKDSGQFQVDLGADDVGATFVNLPVSAADGVGAAVDVSDKPALKTANVLTPFRGGLLIETSEDGVNNWAQVFSFNAEGMQSQIFTAKWMRVRRVGVPLIAPGLPDVYIGFSGAVAGGGAAVIHDGTLTGDGSAGSPLGVIASSLDEAVAVATDGTIDGDGTTALPLGVNQTALVGPAATMTNADAGGAVPIGTPVYNNGAGTFAKARANAAGTARVIGLCQTAFGAGAVGKVQITGLITLTAVQWDVLTGGAGGLTTNTPYYLSAATAGKLTSVAPVAAGELVTPVLVAFSATEAVLNPQEPIQL